MFFRMVCMGILIGLYSTTFCAFEKEVLEWEGSVSFQKTQRLEVIETMQAWEELWYETLHQAAPNVDFKRYSVACVFLGDKIDWLYKIHIGQGKVDKDGYSIEYILQPIVLELSGPYKAQGQYAMQAFIKQSLKTTIRYVKHSGDLQ